LATITKTITNTVRLYGVEPQNKWGSLVWGTDTWAQQDVQWKFDKYLPLNLSLSFQNAFKIRHLVSESVILSTIISRQIFARASSSLSLSSRVVSVSRINNGWYVQRLEETNLLDVPNDNFTEIADTVTSWTQLSSTSTTWVQT
jgi:hypothetical protein